MNDIIEISELDLNDDNFRPTRIGSSSGNFGGGLELLMNDKVSNSNKPTSDIDLEDLNNLENELNELTEDIPRQTFNAKSDMFSSQNINFDDSDTKHSVRFNEEPSIGADTNTSSFEALDPNDNKTWDGYGKFNNVPLNPDKYVHSGPQMTKEELLREKFKYLRKLEALEKK